MSRTLYRPMFRRGGSAGEGITSGLRRGYSSGQGVSKPGGNNPQYYPPRKESSLNSLSFLNTPPPELPRSTSGADFWLNLGTNILAQPGGRPILQTLGTAGKEPLKQFQQQRGQEKLLEYKHGQAERQFQLEWYKSLNPDEKLKVQKEMKFFMDKGMTEEEALNQIIYRKKQHPDETKRIEEQTQLQQQKEDLNFLLNNYADDDLGQGIALTPAQGKKVQDFHDWAEENNKLFQPYYAVIDPEDFRIDQLQTNSDTGNKILPSGIDLETYKPGFHYIDVGTNTVYMISDSGAELIAVDIVSSVDMVPEE